MKSPCISCNFTHHVTVFSNFSRFIGRKWKLRRANLGLFRIQPRAPPPAGNSSKFIWVAEKLLFSNKRKKYTQMVKFTVIGTPSSSFSFVLISASSSQVLNLQILWVVSLFDNALARKLIVLSN